MSNQIEYVYALENERGEVIETTSLEEKEELLEEGYNLLATYLNPTNS